VFQQYCISTSDLLSVKVFRRNWSDQKPSRHIDEGTYIETHKPEVMPGRSIRPFEGYTPARRQMRVCLFCSSLQKRKFDEFFNLGSAGDKALPQPNEGFQ